MKKLITRILVIVGVVVGGINDIEAQLITTQPVDDVICEGGNAEFIVMVTNLPATSFQWQSYNGSVWFDLSNTGVYSGVDNDTLNLISPSLTYNDSSYRCIVTEVPNTDTSDIVQVVINENLPASVTISVLSNDTICTGDEVTFTADPDNEGNSPTYQWFIDGNDIAVNNISITTDTMTVDHDVYCIVISSLSCPVNNYATSNTIEMTVNPNLPASVTISVMLNDTICSGDEVTFTANPVNEGASPTYQWFIDGDDIAVNNISITTDTMTVDHDVYCIVISSLPCPVNNFATSNTIEMTVNPNLPASVTISVMLNDTICSGDEVTFTANPINEGASPTYQWFIDGDDIAVNNISITTDTMTVDHDVYCIVISSLPCPVNNYATSNTIEITVFPNLPASVTISVQSNDSICSGDEVTFTADPENEGPSPIYQWFIDGNDIGVDNISITTDTLSVDHDIYCIMFSSFPCPENNFATSNTIELKVFPNLPASINITVLPDDEICSGEELTFTAEPVNEGSSPIYQWFIDGNDIGVDNISITTDTLSVEHDIYCIMFSSLPCPENNFAISNTIGVIVHPYVDAGISIIVSKNPVCDNEMVTFTISDTLNGGNDPEFEWFLNSEPTSTAYTWSSFVSDNDEVYVQMDSKALCVNINPVISNPITMMVNASPVLLNSGDLVPKPLNNPDVLIFVDSVETNTYQWYVNGVEVPSANEQFYAPEWYDSTFSFNCEYYVMVENELCFSNSNSYTYAINKSGLFEKSEVFLAYPNPNKGNFSIALNEEVVPEDFESCKVRILDVTGKVVFSEEIFEIIQEIDLPGMQSGLYFLEVNMSDSQYQVKKLIIE